MPKSIKKALLFIIIAIPVITSLTFLLRHFKNHTSDSGANQTYGTIDLDERDSEIDKNAYDQEMHEDSDYWDDSWESDIAIEDDGINLYYKNMETVFHYLPIGVIKTLRQETSEFLIRNGYSDETSITILTNTIIGDREEVEFQCTVDNYPDMVISIHYKPRIGIVDFAFTNHGKS